MKTLALALILLAFPAVAECELKPGLAFRFEVKTRAEIAWLALNSGEPSNTFALALFPGTHSCIVWMPPTEGIPPTKWAAAFCLEAKHCQDGFYHD